MVLEDLLVELEDANVYDKVRALKNYLKTKDSRVSSKLELEVDPSIYWIFLELIPEYLDKQENE